MILFNKEGLLSLRDVIPCNQKIINPAVVEVSTKSDIKILPELFRRGRKVPHSELLASTEKKRASNTE